MLFRKNNVLGPFHSFDIRFKSNLENFWIKAETQFIIYEFIFTLTLYLLFICYIVCNRNDTVSISFFSLFFEVERIKVDSPKIKSIVIFDVINLPKIEVNSPKNTQKEKIL